MKKIFCMMMILVLVLGVAACSGEREYIADSVETVTSSPPVLSAVQPPVQNSSPSVSTAVETQAEVREENSMINIYLQIGEQTFTATLLDSEAVRAFIEYLPMKIQMNELNGQEKFYQLPENLPSASTERPPSFSSGDIMCWSGNTLVLFYSAFPNSYGGYVRLGAVDQPGELAEALGNGNIDVAWSLAE